jgi:hypothetical protein
MAVETPSLFAQVIQEHLELKRQNSTLERQMPISGYMAEDPFENHPLFKTEEQARVEDTMSGQESILQQETSLDWPAAEDTFISPPEAPLPPQVDEPAFEVAAPAPFGFEDVEAPGEQPDLEEQESAARETPLPEPDAESEDGLWTRSRDFDWGD